MKQSASKQQRDKYKQIKHEVQKNRMSNQKPTSNDP